MTPPTAAPDTTALRALIQDHFNRSDLMQQTHMNLPEPA
jgi:hypothetical protein